MMAWQRESIRACLEIAFVAVFYAFVFVGFVFELRDRLWLPEALGMGFRTLALIPASLAFFATLESSRPGRRGSRGAMYWALSAILLYFLHTGLMQAFLVEVSTTGPPGETRYVARVFSDYPPFLAELEKKRKEDAYFNEVDFIRENPEEYEDFVQTAEPFRLLGIEFTFVLAYLGVLLTASVAVAKLRDFPESSLIGRCLCAATVVMDHVSEYLEKEVGRDTSSGRSRSGGPELAAGGGGGGAEGAAEGGADAGAAEGREEGGGAGR